MDLKVAHITFQTDHPQMQKPKGNLCITEGAVLSPPHWIPVLNRNYPVSFSRGKPVVLEVFVTNNSKSSTCDFFLEGISKSLKWRFSSKFVVANRPGSTTKQTLTCNTRLPNRVTRMSEKIEWFAQDFRSGRRVSIGETGPHEIFVTWDKPIVKTSRGNANVVTYNRLAALTSRSVAGEKADLNSIAAAIHNYCNLQLSGDVNGLHFTRNNGTKDWSKWHLLHTNERLIWGLLDYVPTKAPGMCGEAAHLMELMFRLLGIDAMQKHVHATDDRTVLAKEKNVSWCKNGVFQEPAVSTRKHSFTGKSGKHGAETLYFNFADKPGKYKLQGGEGCCEIAANKKLYAGMLKHVGERSRGRNAVQDLMLKLEKAYPWHFQTWAHHNDKPCKEGPFPKVPV